MSALNLSQATAATRLYLMVRAGSHQDYIDRLESVPATCIESIKWVEGELSWRRKAVAALKQAYEHCTENTMRPIVNHILTNTEAKADDPTTS